MNSGALAINIYKWLSLFTGIAILLCFYFGSSVYTMVIIYMHWFASMLAINNLILAVAFPINYFIDSTTNRKSLINILLLSLSVLFLLTTILVYTVDGFQFGYSD